MKKLTIEITDEAALKEAFPQLFTTETIVREVVDKSKLRKLANAYHEAGAAVPGVNAYYASEQEADGVQ